VPPFLRRALVTASLLLEAGRFNADDGEPHLPMLTVGGGGAAAASEKLVFSQEQCVAALLAGDQSDPHCMQLLTSACTCSRCNYVCEHILACRVLHRQRGLPRVWPDTELQLYGFDVTRVAAASSAAPAVSEEAVLDVAASAAPSRDARADMLASLLFLVALVPDLDAAEVERVAPQWQRAAFKAFADAAQRDCRRRGQPLELARRRPPRALGGECRRPGEPRTPRFRHAARRSFGASRYARARLGRASPTAIAARRRYRRRRDRVAARRPPRGRRGRRRLNNAGVCAGGCDGDLSREHRRRRRVVECHVARRRLCRRRRRRHCAAQRVGHDSRRLRRLCADSIGLVYLSMMCIQ